MLEKRQHFLKNCGIVVFDWVLLNQIALVINNGKVNELLLQSRIRSSVK
jgi:hypothetical protein